MGGSESVDHENWGRDAATRMGAAPTALIGSVDISKTQLAFPTITARSLFLAMASHRPRT